jgi:hypothetical protein
MNLRTYFRNNNRDAIPFVTKSEWNPPILDSMPLKNYFNINKYEVKGLQTERIKNNLYYTIYIICLYRKFTWNLKAKKTPSKFTISILTTFRSPAPSSVRKTTNE